MIGILTNFTKFYAEPTGKGESIFMKAVLIPGDGIGREIAESVRAVSTALNTGIEWQEFAAGAEYAAESGELLSLIHI